MKFIETDRAPAAIGPYSQAVTTGNLLFISGQIPLDPATGSIVDGGISEQTDRVMQNIRAIVEQAGGSMKSLLKTTIYVRDIAAFAEVNAAYEKQLDGHKPARATVEVSGLPKNVLVEIEAVAEINAS